ncbi:hypothetical protein Bca4012_072390 [Brassica carinata]
MQATEEKLTMSSSTWCKKEINTLSQRRNPSSSFVRVAGGVVLFLKRRSPPPPFLPLFVFASLLPPPLRFLSRNSDSCATARCRSGVSDLDLRRSEVEEWMCGSFSQTEWWWLRFGVRSGSVESSASSSASSV